MKRFAKREILAFFALPFLLPFKLTHWCSQCFQIEARFSASSSLSSQPHLVSLRTCAPISWIPLGPSMCRMSLLNVIWSQNIVLGNPKSGTGGKRKLSITVCSASWWIGLLNELRDASSTAESFEATPTSHPETASNFQRFCGRIELSFNKCYTNHLAAHSKHMSENISAHSQSVVLEQTFSYIFLFMCWSVV